MNAESNTVFFNQHIVNFFSKLILSNTRILNLIANLPLSQGRNWDNFKRGAQVHL